MYAHNCTPQLWPEVVAVRTENGSVGLHKNKYTFLSYTGDDG